MRACFSPEAKTDSSATVRRGEALEVHPLVRDYFARQLQKRGALVLENGTPATLRVSVQSCPLLARGSFWS